MPNSTSDDDRITLTPISRPDPADQDARRRRRTFLAGAAALIVVAGGITWWVVSANKDSKPTKHTAELPLSFGDYIEAKPGDTEWKLLDDVNTDITKGSVDLTYRAADGRAVIITVAMDLPTDHPAGASDDAVAGLLGTNVDSGEPASYSAGKAGGKIECSDLTAGKGTMTYCTWQTEAATATLSPVLDHHTVVSKDAPADFRDFLEALRIEPKK